MNMRAMRASGQPGEDQLAGWLAEGYAPAFRTAMLILGDPSDAEEAVQDAFLRAWRFRAAVPPGDGVKPWMYRVVVNAALSKLRADKARRIKTVTLGDNPLPSPAGLDHPESAALGQERQRVLLAALATLPEPLRVVVALRYYAQLSEKEIAGVIHRRPGTVKSRLHEARLRLGRDPQLAALVDPESAGTAGMARSAGPTDAPVLSEDGGDQ